MADKKYVYVRLTESLSALNCQVNVWGAVHRLEPPRATRGTDFLMSIWLVDPSSDNSESSADKQGIEVRFWAAEKIYKTATPTGAQVGDILRIHRATVREYDGRRFLEVKVANHSLGQAWISFRGAMDGDEQPYAQSSRSFTFSEDDKLRLRGLRRYIEQRAQAGFPIDQPLIERNAPEAAPRGNGAAGAGAGAGAGPDKSNDKYLKRSKDLHPKRTPFADLICQVLGIDKRYGGSVMYVWDGMDTEPRPLHECTLEGGRRFDMPIRSVEGCQVLQPEFMVPGLGSMIPVVDTKGKMMTSTGPYVGQWIRLRNVAVHAVGGQTQLLYTSNSSWRLLGPNDPSASQVHDMYHTNLKKRRAVSGHACSFPIRWATRTTLPAHELDGVLPEAVEGMTADHIAQMYAFPLSTLREVTMGVRTNDRRDPQDQRTQIRFASLVRCVEVLTPLDALVHPVGPYAEALLGRDAGGALRAMQDASLPTHAYQIELVLEDATGRAPVRLTSPHADVLFGVTAEDVARDPAAARHVASILTMLTQGFPANCVRREGVGAETAVAWLGDANRLAPWMEVGIKAVKLARYDAATRERQLQWAYFMVNTRLNEDALRLDVLGRVGMEAME